MISKKGGNAPWAADLEYMGGREETNPPQASVLYMGIQYLLYRTDNRFAARFCCGWRAVLWFDSRFLCDIAFLFFPKSTATATHRNHMKCVCALFILVLVVQKLYLLYRFFLRFRQK